MFWHSALRIELFSKSLSIEAATCFNYLHSATNYSSTCSLKPLSRPPRQYLVHAARYAWSMCLSHLFQFHQLSTRRLFHHQSRGIQSQMFPLINRLQPRHRLLHLHFPHLLLLCLLYLLWQNCRCQHQLPLLSCPVILDAFTAVTEVMRGLAVTFFKTISSWNIFS